MKRRIFAIILAVSISALLMDVTWMIYEEHLRENEEKRKDNNGIDEEVIPTPDDVNLTMNISSRGLTNYSNDFMVDGAPEGSNITWLLDDRILGYDEIDNYHFMDTGYYALTAQVSWDKYTMNLTEELEIELVNRLGSMYLTYPWYWFMEIDPWWEVITTIEPGLTEPTLWVNISLTLGNTMVKCWIELMEDDKMESFEILSYDVIPLGQMQYYRSHFFDKDFFAQREVHEPYFFLIRLELSDPESAIIEGEVAHELVFGS